MIAPTLIIGLGGIGSEIVSMVEKKARILGIDTSNVKFILIDTDNGALLNRRRKGFSGTTIRISSNITVERCLEYNRKAKEEWYPNNSILNNKTLTDGAGQVRAISRLALEHAVLQGMLTPLYDDIIDLHLTHRNPECKTLRIALVSSLAGGTGSGLILPLALYIANHLKSNYRQNGYNMSGFFVMPDIVLKGNEDNTVERISLYSNAYATIKELDDFIQRSVGTKDVAAQISLQNTCNLDDKLPIYNFNFLFETKNNFNYDTLNSTQAYKEMIADCIFMPYCSPINESNSAWEDNKFKHLTIMLTMDEKNKVYRHFGSIGVATMQYPYKKIKSYLTMSWAQDMLEERWFYYDEKYEEELSIHEKMRKKGMAAKEFTTRSQHYKELVNQETIQFSKEIKDSLVIKNDIGETETEAWTKYMTEVEKRIEESVSEHMKGTLLSYNKALAMVLRKLEKGRGKNKKGFETYGNRYRYLYSFAQKSIHHQKKALVSELYEPYMFADTVDKPYLLEYWFANDSFGNHLSPNGVRYFLQNVYECMVGKEGDITKSVKSIRQNYEAEIKIIERLDSISNKELRKKYEEMLTFFTDMVKKEVFLCCLQSGKQRVKKLLSTYEQLFIDYREGMEQLDYKKKLVLNEITSLNGSRVEMVYCQKEHLDVLMDEMKHKSDYYGTLSAVYEQIYNMASEIIDSDKILKERKGNNWARLLEKWEENFEEAYGNDFNVDVITALKWQAEFKLGKIKDNGQIQDSMIKVEMENCIKMCREGLAAPFLSTSIDRYQNTIKENYFSSELCHLRGIEKEIVEKELSNKNGVEDSTMIDKYTIFFYQSTFGIHAKNLVPFTKNGRSFDDYGIITRYMHINKQKDQILTPHIDKKWHRTDQLPEIDAEIQREKVAEEWAVLIYGYVSGKIVKDDNQYRMNVYLDHEACDSMYKVMEVIREYREDKEYLSEEMKREFSKTELVTNTYKDDVFYKNYLEKDIIQDVYFTYANSLRKEKLMKENCAEMFFAGWKKVLCSFLEKYFTVYDMKLKELIKEQINKNEGNAQYVTNKDYAKDMLKDISFREGSDIIEQLQKEQ